jgi:hypothetical protein
MKFATKNMARVAVIAMIIAAASTLASAQLNSNAPTITLNATLNEAVTVSLSANTVNFSMTPGSATNNGSTGITATTNWSLAAGRTAVSLYAYFTSAAVALTGAGGNIPSSAFKIQVGGVGAFNALTNTVTAPGAAPNAGLQLGTATTITAANRVSSRSDAMAFQIDLSGGTLPTLPVGNYTGTLNIAAQATP